jgi:glutathione S-transferase
MAHPRKSRIDHAVMMRKRSCSNKKLAPGEAMGGAMKLYWSSRSPFVRKVMVFAHEAGIAGRIDCVRTIVAPTRPNGDVMADNPLNKLPTLIAADGPLYDSRVICEYLDTLHDGAKLFPPSGPARIAALRRQALADGMLDFLVLWYGERQRPPEHQSAPHLDAYRLKLTVSLDALERDADALGRAPFGIGQVATGCALAYVDFRFADENWRSGRPQLAAWYAAFAQRPSMTATEHADVY